MRNKITKNSKLKDILEMEGTEEILEKYGVPCLSCPLASFEIESLKIGEVAKAYGLELAHLLKELNKVKHSR